jgi:Patatin-like phospholipase
MPATSRNGDRADASPTVAVVLPGGGARGAYEIGAMSVMLPALEARGEHVTVWCGTSVGAVDAALLASLADRPAREQVERAAGLWLQMRKAGRHRTDRRARGVAATTGCPPATLAELPAARRRAHLSTGITSAASRSSCPAPSRSGLRRIRLGTGVRHRTDASGARVGRAWEVVFRAAHPDRIGA